MAQVSLNNDEPLKIIHLVEQLFPEVKLDPLKKALDGLTFNGTLQINKVTGKGETLQVKVIFPA